MQSFHPSAGHKTTWRTLKFSASVKGRLDPSPIPLTRTEHFCAVGRKTRWPAVQSDWHPGTFSACFHVSTAEWINDQARTIAILLASCWKFRGNRKSIYGEHHLHGSFLAIPKDSKPWWFLHFEHWLKHIFCTNTPVLFVLAILSLQYKTYLCLWVKAINWKSWCSHTHTHTLHTYILVFIVC